jgi:hypothetical protein
MSKGQTSKAAKGADDAATAIQQNIEQISRASEHFMKGVMNAAVRQMELGQSLIEAGMEDFNLVARARTPESLLQAELEVFRRRSERLAAAMQTASEDLRQAWSATLDLTRSGASPPVEPGEPTKPAA